MIIFNKVVHIPQAGISQFPLWPPWFPKQSEFCGLDHNYQSFWIVAPSRPLPPSTFSPIGCFRMSVLLACSCRQLMVSRIYIEYILFVTWRTDKQLIELVFVFQSNIRPQLKYSCIIIIICYEEYLNICYCILFW